MNKFLDKAGLAHFWYRVKSYIDEHSSGGSDTGGATLDIPSGIICAWAGLSDNIPSGWHLCDGTNGTPDLHDRFVLGSGEKYSVGDTGGEEEHLLDGFELVPHSHGILAQSSVHISQGKLLNTTVVNGTGRQADINTQNTYVSAGSLTSSNQKPFPIMPPYYVLCYIMKL